MITRTALWSLAVAITAILALPRAATAQPSDAEIVKLMAEAQTHFEQGRYADAEAPAERAWSQRQTVDIAVALGEIELKLDKADEAAQHLYYARKTLNVSESSDVKKRIDELYAQATKNAGAVVIKPSVPGCTFAIPGRSPQPVDDEPVFFLRGTVSIRVTKPGHKSDTVTVRIVPGDQIDVVVDLVPEGGAEEPVQEKPIWPTVLLASVGGAALITGVGLTIGSRVKYGDAEEAVSCAPFNAQCQADAQATLDDAALLQNVGFGMFGVAAGAAIGLGIYLGVSPSPKQAGNNVRILPSGDGRSWGAVLQGDF